MKCVVKQIKFLIPTIIIVGCGSIGFGQTSSLPPISCDGQGSLSGYVLASHPSINNTTGCILVPLGTYATASDNTIWTVVKRCEPDLIEGKVFLQAGWSLENNCTSGYPNYTAADACNGYWPVLMAKRNCQLPPSWGIAGLDTAKNLGQFCPANGSNPINTFTGNKYQKEIDYVGDGPFPLTFIRHYNSQGAVLWTDSYHGRNITFISDAALGSGINTAKVRNADGKTFTFVLRSGAWVSRDLDVTSTLTPVGSDWKYKTDDNEVETYDSAGNLRTHATAKGFVQTFSYSSPGVLSQVTDPGGRTLKFTYDGAGRLSSFADPANQVTSFTYDSVGNMSRVIYPDGTSRAYKYQNAQFPGALTGIVDENGVLFASFQYDSLGRGISSEHFGGAEKTTLLNRGDGSVTVTDALTAQRTYKFSLIAGVAQLTGQSQPGGSGCAPAASSIEYDASGNPITVTNFNGSVTRSTYYPNTSLVDTVTEAYGTQQARVTQTDWDTVCKLPSRTTTAGVETVIVYDNQCLIRSKTLTDLASSKSQTTTFTYTTTSDGTLANLIKSIDGPLVGSTDLILFGYDARGNLTSVKPPGGLVTQTSNDVHGRPLTTVDPNGKITKITYDLRGRIYQKEDGTATTQYRYYPWGGLSQIVLPNLSYANMVYDGAHRLTSVIDNFGNKINFTLDKMGNQTKQEVFDSAGVLRKNSTAMVDLLNRVYQKNGAY